MTSTQDCSKWSITDLDAVTATVIAAQLDVKGSKGDVHQQARRRIEDVQAAQTVGVSDRETRRTQTTRRTHVKLEITIYKHEEIESHA